MSKGYVYILSNESMPGLVKIGKTTRSVESRAAELYQTGVPTPFKVVHYVFSPDCSELERTMHDCLPDKRVGMGREFFQYDAAEAASLLDFQHNEQVSCWVDEFIPNSTIVDADAKIDERAVSALAESLGVYYPEVAAAMNIITAEELAPALARWRARHARAKVTE